MSQNLQESNGITIAFNSGALVTGATASAITSTVTINYAISGRLFAKTAMTNQALVCEPGAGIDPKLPNAFMTVPAGKVSTFAVLLNAAGAVTIAQGDLVDVGSPAPVSASFPADKAIVGVFKVSNVTNPFIPGTTALNAAGVTTVFTNLAQHPGTSV